MAIVTDTLLNLLRAQIKNHGTVVWYDPEGVYGDLAQSLQPQDIGAAAIQCYAPETGFFRLRHDLEALWGASVDAPTLLIYAPLAQAETHHALVEYESAGLTLRPGQQPQEQNTALAFVARRALEAVFPAAKLAHLLAEVEAGKLTLTELDRQAEHTLDEQAGVLRVIFGTGNAADIALRFISTPALDADIEARDAVAVLASLLADLLGVPLTADTLAGLRARLARQLLFTDFIVALEDDVPPALRTFPVAERSVAREAAVALARAWRNRRDLAESYGVWAGKLQSEVGLSIVALPVEALARAETFVLVETALQTAVEQALLRRPTAALLSLVEARRDTGFWPQQDPALKLRWAVTAEAARVLLECGRITGALKGKTWPAEALLARYAYGEEDGAWCRLDIAQRHLERDAHRFDFDAQHDDLQRLVVRARQQYAAVADTLASTFVKAYADSKFTLPGVLAQSEIYREAIAPLALSGRVAYILVDALRYEMAQELSAILAAEWQTTLSAALATPPTITEVGMVALLPGAEDGLTLDAIGGKLTVSLRGGPLKTRQERVEHFQKTAPGPVVVAKLEDLAPLSDKHLRQSLGKAQVALITATEEIDGLCENNPALARRMLDDVFNQTRRGLKALFQCGFETAILTADHGYLFGAALTSGEGMDAPGGDTVALKRRVWVGRGGAHADGYLRAPLAAFGIGGDLELATPWNLAAFKVKGGALEYFHGGLSLPEVVIPVLTVRASGVHSPAPGAEITWTLTPGSKTISTRFISVTVAGQTEQLLPLEPPLVRLEVRAGAQVLSTPVAATYGFNDVTKDVQLALHPDTPNALAANTITLMIVAEDAAVTQVSLTLLDAATGITLKRLDNVPFALTF